MKTKITVLVSACIIFCTLSAPLYAQKTDTAWVLTLPGAPSGTPATTSFGFVTLSEGNVLSSITSSGTILYQFFLKNNVSPFYTAFPSDHICLVQADYKTLTLLNPDGVPLWHSTLPFHVTEAPYYCDNGSILCFGTSDIAAVSWNGTLLWHTRLSTPWTIRPFATDNGLLAVPSTDGNTTTIEFLSPFGISLWTEKLDTVFSAFTAGQDSITGLTGNGTVICYTFSGQHLVKKWESSADEQCACIVPLDTRSMLLTSDGRVKILRTSDGTELSSDTLWEMPLSNLRCIARNTVTVIAGETISRTMVILISDQGKPIWMKNLPTKDPVFMTKSGLLCQYTQDWAISSWDTPAFGQDLRKNASLTADFLSSWGTDGVPDRYIEMRNTLLSVSERSRSSSAVTALESYGELGTMMPYYLEDIRQSAVSGWDFSRLYAEIISNETDTALLKETLVAAGKAPFDSSRKVLNAIELRLKNNRSGIFNDSLCFETCTTVYKICAFMGTPAIINQGQRILSQLIQPLYPTKVQQEAIATIRKLIELQKETQM